MRMIARLGAVFLGLLALPVFSWAQAITFDQWFDQRVRDLKLADVNSKAPEKQRETPAVASGSTSLVDRSAASDFVSLALGLVPIGGNTGGTGGNRPALTSMTISAYSLAAWGSGRELTDPAFYRVHKDLRRLYVTLGTAESGKDDDNTDRSATVIGVKYLIINQRDIYARPSLKYLSGVQDAVTRAGALEAGLKERIKDTVFRSESNDPADRDNFLENFGEAKFPAFLQSLKPETLKRVDELIRSGLPTFAGLQTAIETAYDAMHKGQQLALSGTASLRPDPGNDDYRMELIYDHGLSKNVTWTVNASGDYKDRKQKEDQRGGRVATEFLGTLNRSDERLWGRSPATLSFSGEAKWHTKAKPIYTFQTKLTIPIVTGIELPVAYRYANRTSGTNTADPEARLGLSVDIGRLAELF
jgi:hypothetical protein